MSNSGGAVGFQAKSLVCLKSKERHTHYFSKLSSKSLHSGIKGFGGSVRGSVNKIIDNGSIIVFHRLRGTDLKNLRSNLSTLSYHCAIFAIATFLPIGRLYISNSKKTL